MPPLSNIRIRLSEASLRSSVKKASRPPVWLPWISQRPAGPLKRATGLAVVPAGWERVEPDQPLGANRDLQAGGAGLGHGDAGVRAGLEGPCGAQDWPGWVCWRRGLCLRRGLGRFRRRRRRGAARRQQREEQAERPPAAGAPELAAVHGHSTGMLPQRGVAVCCLNLSRGSGRGRDASAARVRVIGLARCGRFKQPCAPASRELPPSPCVDAS